MTDFESWAKGATDPGNRFGKPEALPGLRVLEFSPGHFGGMVAASILGEFGAEVIKVEPPGGDPTRRFRLDSDEPVELETSPLFLHLNTNKSSI
ncbi:MAG: CoA transferase, partial [Candidatus Deferrimicrobiaceae bacterium]